MKRVSIVIATVLLFMLCCIGVSADSAGLFKGLNLLPELCEKADSDLVRRDEFAAVTGALNGFTMQAPVDTAFTDVKADNAYSGMIQFLKEAGILNGVSETEYEPAESLTYKQALTAYVKLLGYQQVAEKRGGWPNGYVQVAANLDLFDKLSVPLDSPLTFGQLWELTDWALETEAAHMVLRSDNGELVELPDLSEDGQTLLEKNLKLTAYEAVVNSVNAKDYGVYVTITDSRNGSTYKEGDRVYFSAPVTINLVAYDKAPVKIWVDDEDELFYIAMQRKCEVKYGTVYSVNGDSSDTRYQANAISELYLWDDETEYEVHPDGLSFYYNDAIYNGSISLQNRYVRMVLQEGDIVSIEAWDFAEGGIVSEITFKSIMYNRGDVSEQIRDLENYEKQILILNGENRDIKDLKTDTLIDYYVSSDKKTLIILGSERKITATLHTISESELQLGNHMYARNAALYAAEDGVTYKEDAQDRLLGVEVMAYFDSYGRVRYLKPAEKVEKSDFIGYITGKRETGGFGHVELRVVNLEDDAFPSNVYKISEKTKFIGLYDNELTAEAVYATAGDINGSGVYRFRVNAEGELTEISKLTPYYGFDLNHDGLVSTSVSSFMQNSHPYVSITEVVNEERISQRLYVERNAPITAMYQEGSELCFSRTNWLTLEAASASGVNLAIYGPEMSSDYDLLLLSGNVDQIQASSTGNRYGIVTALANCVLPNGDAGKMVTIGGQQYMMTVDMARGLQKNSFVYYNPKKHFGDEPITVLSYFNLEGDEIYDWVGAGNGSVTIYSGNVVKVDSKRIYFEDGSVHWMRPGGCTYMMQIAAGKLTDGSAQDPLVGKTIVYAADPTNHVINTIFYTE